MNNCFYFFTCIVAILQIYANVAVSFKIDSCISFINEKLIEDCITEKSKLEALEFNDISYLVINQQLLIDNVDNILNDNLPYIDHLQQYYFYDSLSLTTCKIGENYCNSVQIKISLYFHNQQYERELRYEPIQT